MNSRFPALVLLVALAPLALDGCVSVGVTRDSLPEATDTGALEVSIYERASDAEAARVLETPVLSELSRIEKATETIVARSMSPRWKASALPPGRYRLHLSKRLDSRGNVVPLAREAHKSFEVRAGEVARLSVVLKKTPGVLIAAAAVTLVALTVLSIEWAKEGKIPLPTDLPLPPVHVVVAIDLALDAGSFAGHASPAPGPEIGDVFPAPGSVVAAPRVTVSFLFAAPLDPDRIEAGAVVALGSESGEIGGVLSWRPDEQLLTFTPDRDFTPGETVTVTVDLAKLHSLAGRAGEGLFSTRFDVPGSAEDPE